MKKVIYSLVALATLAMPAMAQEKVDVVVGFENPEGAALNQGVYGGEKKGTPTKPFEKFGDKNTERYDCTYKEGLVTFYLDYDYNTKYKFGTSNGISFAAITETDYTYKNLYFKNVKGGGSKSKTYGIVSKQGACFELADNAEVKSIDIVNAVYPLKYILKSTKSDEKFVEGDNFVLHIAGYKTLNDKVPAKEKEIVLVEFKTGATEVEYIKDWQTVDLSEFLGQNIKCVKFNFTGTKKTSYGLLSTPAYVAIDNIVLSTTKAVPGGITTVNNEKAVEVARYSIDGTQLSAPQHGLNIVKMSDGTTRKVMVK